MAYAIATREEMKEHALEMMKALDILPAVVRHFKKEDVLEYSEQNGCVYFLEDDMKEAVKRVEEEHDVLVYFVNRCYHKDFGEMWNMCCVSKYKDDWKVDLAEVKDGYVFCWVENKSAPDLSELGDCVFRPVIGGLCRIG